MWTSIQASKEQADKLYSKWMTFYISKTYVSERKDPDGYEQGYMSVRLSNGWRLEYQMRGDEPCFAKFETLVNIRYEIPYPEKLSQPMYDKLQKWGLEARKEFWKGATI